MDGACIRRNDLELRPFKLAPTFWVAVAMITYLYVEYQHSVVAVTMGL